MSKSSPAVKAPLVPDPLTEVRAYIILTAREVGQLEQKVNSYLYKGWECVGGVSATSVYSSETPQMGGGVSSTLCQAMLSPK